MNFRDEKILRAFAKNLQTIRKSKNFTQEELAYQSEITLSQIARIETARINPSLSTIFQLAKTMKIPIQEFFEFELE